MSKSTHTAQETSTANPVLPRVTGKYLCWPRMGGGLLAVALNLASVAPAAALLCSTADPAFVPGGTVLNSTAADAFNNILVQTGTNTPSTLSFLSGSTAYTLSNSQPFIVGRTFLYNPNQPQAGAVGSFLLPLAQLRGLTREQYLNFFALPNTPGQTRNNAIALVVVPSGTTMWSGIAGPITDREHRLVLGQRRCGRSTSSAARSQEASRSHPPITSFQLPTMAAQYWRTGRACPATRKRSAATSISDASRPTAISTGC